MADADGLLNFFHQYPYSLFSIDLPDERLRTRYARMEDLLPEDRGFLLHVNYDALTCILYKEFNRAERLSDSAIKLDGEHPHTWCNRGVLAMKRDPPRMKDAEKAAFKVLELIAEKPLLSKLKTKIDYAYYLAEVLRTEESRDRSCEIFEECAKEVTTHPKMPEYLSYVYAKILIRQIRSLDKYDKPQSWMVQKLEKVIEQLIILNRSSNEEDQAYMSLWLAELQSSKIHPISLCGPLRIFSSETGIVKTDLESCVHHAMNLDSKHQHERKIRARIARMCLDIAYHYAENLDDDDTRIILLVMH